MSLARLIRTFLTISCLMPLSALAAETEHEWQFVMAHKPDNADNIALIQNFADRVYERTGGTLHITPIMPNQLKNKLGQRQGGTHGTATAMVYTGEAEMSQISVKKFLNYSTELDVLDAPLMFSSHEHASRVLDGDIGARLRDTVYEGSNGNLKGLAFTYSGGFRNIYSTKDIDSLSDLRGLNMRMLGGRMSRDVVEGLGLKPFFIRHESPEWVQAHQTGAIEAEEAETIRIAQYHRKYPEVTSKIKTVIETYHNLFLTMLTVNGPAYRNLTAEQRQVLEEEAQKLAIAERELSIRQESEAKAMFQKMGIKYVDLSKEEREQLRKVAEKVNDKYNKHMGSWMAAIAEVDPNRSFAGTIPAAR